MRWVRRVLLVLLIGSGALYLPNLVIAVLRDGPSTCHGQTRAGWIEKSVRLTGGAGAARPQGARLAERQNLAMRMHMRRFTRLTNAFSKKFENHMHMVALYTVFCNFCRIRKTLCVTPAMEAGLTDHVWEMEDIIAAMDAVAPKPGKRGAYKRRS